MALNGSGLYCSIFGKPEQGLYCNIFGRPQQGIFGPLFSKFGSPSISNASDARLGDDTSSTPLYQQLYMGLPLWMYGLFILGVFIGKR